MKSYTYFVYYGKNSVQTLDKIRGGGYTFIIIVLKGQKRRKIMKKRFFVTLLAVVMAVSCVLGLAACGAKVDGTYYAYIAGVKQDGMVMKLDDGKVSLTQSAMGQEISVEGTYAVDGDTVSITVSLLGISTTQKLTRVSDGVLKGEEEGSIIYYCQDGKTPPAEEESAE